MKNYLIQLTDLPAVRQMCRLHEFSFSYKPALKAPGMVWLSIYYPDSDLPLSAELCFALGRSLEIQLALMKTDPQETYVELNFEDAR